MLGRSTRRGDPAIFLGLMMRKALLVVFLLSSCGGVAPNAPSQSEIDNAYCQDMMRQAEHATSMNAAVMQNLAQTQPGPVTRAAADAAKTTAPVILRQTYLNCMDNRGYSAAEAAAIGHLTP